jgi:hypothetical protein
MKNIAEYKMCIADGKDEHRKGLLQMKMAEGAKLQMCYLLQHLCDIQLRHRVESIIAFSHDFIGDLQTVRNISIDSNSIIVECNEKLDTAFHQPAYYKKEQTWLQTFLYSHLNVCPLMLTCTLALYRVAEKWGVSNVVFVMLSCNSYGKEDKNVCLHHLVLELLIFAKGAQKYM